MLISEALKASGHEGKVKIAMDCAASEFHGARRAAAPPARPRLGQRLRLGAHPACRAAAGGRPALVVFFF